MNSELLVSESFVGSGEKNTWFPVAFMIDKDGQWCIHIGKKYININKIPLSFSPDPSTNSETTNSKFHQFDKLDQVLQVLFVLFILVKINSEVLVSEFFVGSGEKNT